MTKYDKHAQIHYQRISTNLHFLKSYVLKNQWRYGSSGLRSWLQKIGNLHLTSHRVSQGLTGSQSLRLNSPFSFLVLLSKPCTELQVSLSLSHIGPTCATMLQSCFRFFLFVSLVCAPGIRERWGTNVQCAWHHGAASSTSTDVVAVRFNFLVEARLFESRREFFPPS